MKRLALNLFLLVAAVCSVSCDPVSTFNTDTLTGSLLDVKTDNIPEKRISYEGMEVSFNPEAHIPNWVAWELTADETLGTEPRYDRFMPDKSVRGSAYSSDYRGSGYDRGHMAPAGDMKWSEKAMRETFYMTNICPQAHKLNAGAWKKLEEKCRQWAVRDSAIYIVCGPVLNDPVDEWIGESEVAVPQRFFKVILAPYANPPRGIGFIMPNGYVPGGMQKAACSIDEVEAITGFDFFSALPDSLENEIERRANFHLWTH